MAYVIAGSCVGLLMCIVAGLFGDFSIFRLASVYAVSANVTTACAVLYGTLREAQLQKERRNQNNQSNVELMASNLMKHTLRLELDYQNKVRAFEDVIRDLRSAREAKIAAEKPRNRSSGLCPTLAY